MLLADESHTKGGIKHNGKESSEGREEKGRQEAVTAASRQKRGRRSPPFLLVRPTASGLLQTLPVPDPHALDHVQLLALVHHVHPVHHSSEHPVLPINLRPRRLRNDAPAP